MPLIELPLLVMMGMFMGVAALIVLTLVYFQLGEKPYLQKFLVRALLIFALLAAVITLLLSCPLSSPWLILLLN
ncbi:MAG: hypothetical protein U0401_25440 [Anaerolineae bacterium]